jgi:hypothetical protein
MNTTQILIDLRLHRDRLDQAIGALETLDGRGAGLSAVDGIDISDRTVGTKSGRGRKMSAEGRARIAAATKARWARSRAQNKVKALTDGQITHGRNNLSAAGRKAISEAAKKRWAKARRLGKKTL